ncbi:MAG: hypothetical protein HC877_02725 [Thioploca sp.]|nr:hypothetical protein [Thioploca sp.]
MARYQVLLGNAGMLSSAWRPQLMEQRFFGRHDQADLGSERSGAKWWATLRLFPPYLAWLE